LFHDFKHKLLAVNPVSLTLVTIFAKRYRAKMMPAPSFNPTLKYVMRITWSACAA
jgi:hypothetical protein